MTIERYYDAMTREHVEFNTETLEERRTDAGRYVTVEELGQAPVRYRVGHGILSEGTPRASHCPSCGAPYAQHDTECSYCKTTRYI